MLKFDSPSEDKYFAKDQTIPAPQANLQVKVTKGGEGGTGLHGVTVKFIAEKQSEGQVNIGEVSTGSSGIATKPWTVPVGTPEIYTLKAGTGSGLVNGVTGKKVYVVDPNADWNTITEIKVDAPGPLVSNINSALNNIPGISVTLNQAQGSFTTKERDCCGDNGFQENGEKYTEGNVTLSASIGDIPIWGYGPIEKDFECYWLTAEITIQAGLFGNGNFTAGVTAGKRWDECVDEECFYGSVEAEITVGVKFTFDVEPCVKISGEKYCFDISWTPAQVSATINANVSYKSKESCSGGLILQEFIHFRI